MSIVQITRIKCDGCSRVVDENDNNEPAWVKLSTCRGRAGTSSISPAVSADLCSSCATQLRRRLAEIGIKS